MKVATVKSSWLIETGRRLDTSPYLSGALEIRDRLRASTKLRKDKLHLLTAGFEGGIFNGPKFVRNYVETRPYGVPFMTGSSMLLADLSGLQLLSKRDAYSSKLRHLELKRGASLISCSGTIGKMAYARREMEGVWASQDVLKVVPDPEKIPPGYLYSFLGSKYGLPLVAAGTYGSIIQHLEPRHIISLEVPRLKSSLEKEIHLLVEEAAELRTKASVAFSAAVAEFEEAVGFRSSGKGGFTHSSPVSVGSSALFGRLDTNFHNSRHQSVLKHLRRFSGGIERIADVVVSIVEPLRFKRMPHDLGVRFFGTGNLGHADPEPLYRIVEFSWLKSYEVKPETILIPRSGQIYGILGTAFQPIGDVLGSVITEDAIRIDCRDRFQAGYLSIALRSTIGLEQLKSRAFGGSIPHLDVQNIGAVLLPKIGSSLEDSLGRIGHKVLSSRSKAIERERTARDLLESALADAL